MGGFDNKYMRMEAAAVGDKRKACELEESDQAIDVSDAAPKAQKRIKKMLPKIWKSVNDTISHAQGSLDECPESMSCPIGISYKATLNVRIGCLKLVQMVDPACTKDVTFRDITEILGELCDAESMSTASASRMTVGTKVTNALKYYIEEGGARVATITDRSKVMSKNLIMEVLDNLIQLNTGAELADDVKDVEAALALIQSMVADCKKSSASLKSHIKELKKEPAAQADADRKAREKEEALAASLEKAQLQKRMEATKEDKNAIDKINFAEFVTHSDQTGIRPILEEAKFQSEIAPYPVKLLGANTRVKKFTENDKGKFAALSFGTAYKKEGSEALEACGITQISLYTGEGKEQADELMEDLSASIDGVAKLDIIPPSCAAPMRNVWFEGMIRGGSCCQGMPNGITTVRVQLQGVVRYVLFDIPSTIHALAENSAEPSDFKANVTLDQIQCLICAMDGTSLACLIQKGAEVYTTKLTKDEVSNVL